MAQEGATVSWNKFFVLVVGNTIGPHRDFVEKLKGVGHSEVNSPEECDYLLVFCPVASGVRTDISKALNKIPDDKPTILVVMHHTFDPDHVVAESRRLVTHPDVCLTVDCLFYEDHFLQSNCNHTAWLEVQKHLGVSVSQESTGQAYMNNIRSTLGSIWASVSSTLRNLPQNPSTVYTEVCSHEHDYVMVTVTEEEVLERTSALGSVPASDPAPVSELAPGFALASELAPGSAAVSVLATLSSTSSDPAPGSAVDSLSAPGSISVSYPAPGSNPSSVSPLGFASASDLRDHLHDPATVSWNKFFVLVMGNTIGAHRDFVEKLKGVGHSEVNSPEECDYLLVFCLVASQTHRVIIEALDKVPDDKPTILVVMHHTFDPDHVVAESRRLVTHPDVHLTVDCLFYEDHFLESNCNHTAWLEVQNYLGVSVSQVSSPSSIWKKIRNAIKSTLRSAPGPAPIRRNMPQNPATVSQFFVLLAGNTNRAHRDFVEKFKSVGHTEVNSPEECDYLLVFCPVTFHVGTDINEALNKISAGKPTILVVMHHTFDPDHVVAKSRRLVIHPDVHLTVDCLFYEDHFLESNCNDTAWHEVQKYLGVSVS